MNIIKVIILFTVIALFTACQKKDNTPADYSKVNITFNGPLVNETLHKGDTADIDATITYNNEISGVMVQIIDSAADQVLYQEERDLHTDHFIFKDEWVDTFSTANKLQLVVTVAVANAETPLSKTYYFNVAP